MDFTPASLLEYNKKNCEDKRAGCNGGAFGRIKINKLGGR